MGDLHWRLTGLSHTWWDLENSFDFSALASHGGTWMQLRNRSFSSPTLTLSCSVPGWIMLSNERFGGKLMYSSLSVFLDRLWESGLLKKKKQTKIALFFQPGL